MATNTAKLTNLIDNYQATGEATEPQEEQVVEQAPSIPQSRFGLGPAAEAMLVRPSVISSVSHIPEAEQTDWGTSRYDERAGFQPGRDVEDIRAKMQPWYWKIGNGIVKGGITAATTAANTVAGTIAGAGSSLFELGKQITTPEEFDLGQVLDAGVNNFLSEQLIKLQTLSEDLFPNYRTEVERSDRYQQEWYKHVFTPNFIGDSFIKNFGFTIGAMGGGMVWSSVIGKRLSKNLVNDLMKGAVVAGNGDAAALKALQEAAQAIPKGAARTLNVDAFTGNLKEAAKRYNKMLGQLQLYGAVLGAMGEGNMEGLMAKNEFQKEYVDGMNRSYAHRSQLVEQEVLSSGNSDWVNTVTMIDQNGNQVPYPILTDAGRREIERRRFQLSQEQDRINAEAQEQGNRLASTTFLLNLPILTTSNVIQFGRMFSGGWKTARNTLRLRGGLDSTEDVISASYRGPLSKLSDKAAIRTKTILNALKVSGSEAGEEMSQGFVSSGTKNVAQQRTELAQYNDDGFDEEAIGSFRNWFSQMYAGGSDYLADPKNWQEGFLGAVTGLLGIPGRRWNGGIAEAYRSASEEITSTRAAGDALNNLVNSKEFQDRWRGYIRHMKYDNEMGQAAEDDNQYAWHTANDKQLINDVMTFAKAGRLDDLNQIADRYSSLSDDDIKELRKNIDSGDGTVESWTKNLSDSEVREKVEKQANNIKEAVKDYSEVYDALSSRLPADADESVLDELVFTTLNLKRFEQRFLTKLEETMAAIKPVLDIRKAFTKDDKVIADTEERERRYEELKSQYESAFSSLLPVRLPGFLQSTIDSQLDYLEKIAGEEKDKDLLAGIQDMRKLADDRREYYKKFVTLQTESGQKQHNEEKVTQEKVDDAAAVKAAEDRLANLDTFAKIQNAYRASDQRGKVDLIRSLETVEKTNPVAKAFLDFNRGLNSFQDYVTKNGLPTTNPVISPAMVIGGLNDLFIRAGSEDDLKKLDDSMFMPLEEFKQRFSSPMIPLPDGVYTDWKNAFRDAMRNFLALDNATKTRKTITPTPIQPAPVAAPTNPDASQPGSIIPPHLRGAVVPGSQPQSPAPASVSEEKATTDELPDPATAEGVPTSPSPAPASTEELISEANIAGDGTVEGEAETVDENDVDKTSYLHASINEVESEEAAKIRRGESGDLSDFIEKHPEYADTWQALVEAGAFDTIAEELSVGDEIEFIIDPKFPLYNGDPQILMAVTKNGQRKILSPLSLKIDKYLHLRQLRKAIMDEFASFSVAHPGEVFVFSKTSRVWAKRKGLVDFGESITEDKDIRNISGYNENAPFVFIDRNGNLRVSNSRMLPMEFEDAFPSQQGRMERRGNLYYMAKNGNDSWIPIRVNVEHFNQQTKDLPNEVFQRIRGLIASIANLATEGNTATTDWNAKNEKLKDIRRKLSDLLDIHDFNFEVANYKNVGPALRVRRYSEDPVSHERVHSDTIRRPDQLSVDWLMDLFADSDLSIQIKVDDLGYVKNLSEYIENGLITSNARKMRAKGVDFYVYPWDPGSQSFKPATPTQAKAQQEQSTTPTPSVSPAEAPALEEIPFVSAEEESDDFDDPFDANFGREVTPASPVEQLPMEQKSFSELDDPVLQEMILDKGYTAEQYNALTSEARKQILDCIMF